MELERKILEATVYPSLPMIDRLSVWPLDSLIPLEEEEKPSNILGGIFWFN